MYQIECIAGDSTSDDETKYCQRRKPPGTIITSTNEVKGYKVKVRDMYIRFMFFNSIKKISDDMTSCI